MQQSNFSSHKKAPTKTEQKTAIKNGIIFPVIIWIGGLILAGSEGALMPWLNIAGAMIFLGASVWLGKILPDLEPDTQVKESQKKKVHRPIPVQTVILKFTHKGPLKNNYVF